MKINPSQGWSDGIGKDDASMVAELTQLGTFT